jgi:hypothetical protein
MPAWVEEREFLSETERRVQTEARKRRKQRQEIARQAEEFWSGNVKAEAEPMAESVPQKQKRVAASPEVLESLAATEVPNKPKLKITEITPTPKKQKAVKSFADLEVGGLKEFVEPTAKAEPKPKPQVTDLLGQQSYRYTVGMQKADAKVAQAKSDFLVKLAGWEADAKKRLSELEPDVKKKIEDVRETAAKVEEIPVDMEPEPPKSGSSEMPETQIPNVATAADDARVPRDFAIKKSASRKFSVYTIGSSAVQAVADSYREALLLAHKKRNEKLKRK